MVNGELIDDSVIREQASVLRPRFEPMLDGMDPIEAEMQLREWSREAVVEKVLLRQEALKDPEPIPPERIEEALRGVQAQTGGQAACRINQEEVRRDIEVRLRVDRMLGKVSGKLSPPKHKEVSEYYRKNKDQFYTPEMVRASHIVKHVDEKTDEQTALQTMRRVQEEMINSASFEGLDDRYSDCPGNGGDLGYFPRGQMVQEFDNVVYSLEINQTSDIFRTVFGFHIARVCDRRPAGPRSLEEVRGEIERTLLGQKQDRAIEEFLQRLKAKADIQNVRRQASPVLRS